MENKIINKYIESIDSVLIDRETEDVKADKELSGEQDFFMENEFISVELDSETGYIKSLVNKEIHPFKLFFKRIFDSIRNMFAKIFG